MNTVKIAMLGSGVVAERLMEGLAGVSGQEVVVNYSRPEQTAEQFAARWGISSSSADLSAVSSRDDIDLFVIALPRDEHLAAVLQLAAAERNQVCAKSFGRGRSEAKRMFAAGRFSEKLNGYADALVFAPEVVEAQASAIAGEAGRVLWARTRVSGPVPGSLNAWDAATEGGGVLADLGPHCVEAARNLFGKEDRVVEVMAWGDRLVHHGVTSGEDNALLVLRFSNGGIAHCEVSWTGGDGLDVRHEIHGSAKSFYAGPINEGSLGYQCAMRHFVECVRTGGAARETYEDGYIVDSVIEAGYESMRERRWVQVEY